MRPAAMAARAPRLTACRRRFAFFALALAVILLVTGAVSITKTYLAKREERRRLEAEAAERDTASALLRRSHAVRRRAEPRPGARLRRHPLRIEFRSAGRKPVVSPARADAAHARYRRMAGRPQIQGRRRGATRSTSSTTRNQHPLWHVVPMGISPAFRRRRDQDCLRLSRRSRQRGQLAEKNPQYSADGVTLDVIHLGRRRVCSPRAARPRRLPQKILLPRGNPEPTES